MRTHCQIDIRKEVEIAPTRSHQFLLLVMSQDLPVCGQARWGTPVIPALKRLRHEGCKFHAGQRFAIWQYSSLCDKTKSQENK